MRRKIKLINDVELLKINFNDSNGQPKTPEDAFNKIDKKFIGESEAPIYIIDDFYVNPHDIRDFLFTLPFSKKQYTNNAPGYRCKIDFNVNMMFSQIIGRLFNDKSVNLTQTFFSLIGGDMKLDATQCRPHVDTSGNKYAAVVYLNTDDECNGGTSFYKHIPTGKEVVTSREELRMINDPKNFDATEEQMNYFRNLKDFVTDSNEEWELIDLIPMKFNRAIFYPGNIFHSGYIKRDWFLDNYRITQNIFAGG